MPKHSNRLASEKSPYLLQHAHNPVDWHPWGTEAFERAHQENKPIFLSIGYSTCHWCHVMERESFENESIAEILNQFFVPVKVDREERPDVDRIYMTFVQATTGGGGWPMSVWLTPDLKPFYGGTYYPPDSRWGRPGFRQVLEQLAAAWQRDRDNVIASSDDVLRQLEQYVQGDVRARVQALPDRKVFDSGYEQFRRAFDSRLGGFGGAPKFPRPSAFNFLLRYGVAFGVEDASEMVILTLREMARGGMNDQLGGGFHRYSVDARWFVPHFEKMLYDQGQLAVSYLEGFQITGDPALADIARDIFEYVLRDMTHEGGGFYSAEDADSVIDPAKPNEKGEGAFYIWDADEIDRVLDERTAEWLKYRYGVEPNGNVQEDPHGEFTGHNILFERFSIAETARRFAATDEEVRSALDDAKQKLLVARGSRVRPHLDDKVLTAWNGLMISAFALGARVLGESRYMEAGERAARFVLGQLYMDNTLLRRWRAGDAAVPAFLDDYAFFVQGLIDLYEAGFDNSYLTSAIQLTERMRELFEDTANGGFFSATEADPSLVLRIKEDYDGAEPSGNSIAIANLLRLGHMTGRSDFTDSAQKALAAFSGKMTAGPTSLPQMLAAALLASTPPRQIVLGGPREALTPFRDVLRTRFLPFHTLLWSGSAGINSELQNMQGVNGSAAAYVCENFTCKLPVTGAADLTGLLP